MTSQYLQLMGITTYHLRDNVSSSMKPDLFFSELFQGERSVGCILADIGSNAVSLDDQAALLNKISRALSAEFSIGLLDSRSDVLFNSDASFLVFLGDHAQSFSHVSSAQSVVTSVSLTQLYNNIEEKKLLWQKLKPLSLN